MGTLWKVEAAALRLCVPVHLLHSPLEPAIDIVIEAKGTLRVARLLAAFDAVGLVEEGAFSNGTTAPIEKTSS